MRPQKTLYRLYWLRNRSVNGAMTAQWFIFKTKMNDRFKAQMNPHHGPMQRSQRTVQAVKL